MDAITGYDPNPLIGLLSRGEEQIRQLEAQLGEPNPAELCKSLAQKIRSTLDAAISMARMMDHEGLRQPPACQNHTGGSDSPASDSPRSEDSERVFKDHERRELTKKRKTLPQWSSQVRVSSGGGIEGPVDDGYSWRKYGQKDILGAKYPRGYYRCTHRNSHGCLATKQVQRSDDDPTVFDVTYRGAHTCQHKHRTSTTSAAKEPNMQQNQHSPSDQEQQQQQQKQDRQLLLSFRSGLTLKTEGLDKEGRSRDAASAASFSFPPTPASCLTPDNNTFSPLVLDSQFSATFSPAFVSAANTESNCFSLSQCQMSNNYGRRMSGHSSELDLTEIISAASATSSAMVDMDFMLGPADFDPGFQFDGSNLF